MIARNGLDVVGFVTLTFAENLVCRVEAQKRFNSLASNFLRKHLLEYVCAVERQGRGAIHFHLIAVFAGDIRSGFDFDKLARANALRAAGETGSRYRAEQGAAFASANEFLRSWWRLLRDAAGRYGFGRCETLPLISTGEAVARYVGSYVGSEYVMRAARDRGMRTLRYRLTQRVASVRWSWVGGRGQVWRAGCAALAAFINCSGDLSDSLGKKWAWTWREEIPVLGRHSERVFAALGTLSDLYTFQDRVSAIPRLVEMILAWEKEQNATA